MGTRVAIRLVTDLALTDLMMMILINNILLLMVLTWIHVLIQECPDIKTGKIEVIVIGGVDEVGPSLGAFHGEGGAVVGEGGFVGGVEGAKPVSFFGGGVPDFGGVAAPRPPSHAEESARLGLLSPATSLGRWRWWDWR